MWGRIVFLAVVAKPYFSILKRIVGDVGDTRDALHDHTGKISVSSSGSWVMWVMPWRRKNSAPPYFSILKRIVGDVGVGA